MRKTYTLVSLVFLTLCATTQAQIKKGSIFLGGDIYLSSENTKNVNANDEQMRKYNNFGFAPVAGIAIKDNFIVGGSLNAGFSRNDYSNQESQKGNTFGTGIFARHYKNIGKSGIYVFVQNSLGASYGEQRYEQVNNNSAERKNKSFSVGLNLYPGLSYAISPKLHLETGFNNLLFANYTREKTEYVHQSSSNTRTNRFNIGSSLNNLSSISLGFRALIGK